MEYSETHILQCTGMSNVVQCMMVQDVFKIPADDELSSNHLNNYLYYSV